MGLARSSLVAASLLVVVGCNRDGVCVQQYDHDDHQTCVASGQSVCRKAKGTWHSFVDATDDLPGPTKGRRTCKQLGFTEQDGRGWKQP